MKIDKEGYEKFCDRLGLSEHPLGVFYSDEEPSQGIRPKGGGRECLIALLKGARHHGGVVYFDEIT